MKRVHLWVDQYGNKIYARTVDELKTKAGGGRVGKMYVDRKDGRTLHIGYVVGKRWFSRFAPVEKDA